LRALLGEELARLGVQLSPEIRLKLEIYIAELERWSRRMNLTSLEGRDLVRRLVAEPCWIGQQLQMSGTILDLGSGNGSPGIPLYLGCGLQRADLIEVRVKRAAFLRNVAALLAPENIVVHRLRLEDMTFAPRSEWITLQGVKPVAALLKAFRRLFSPTTRVVWITSGADLLPASSTISVPDSKTVVQVLHLDQF
jgi:16S rRNA (guanine527-N7)-methyltransferase